MRPTKHETDAEVYECLICGTRLVAPDEQTCPDCGSSLWNLGRSRDL